MYYRYWMHKDGSHNVTANYGIRTDRYKLVFYYGQPLGMKGTKETPVIPAEWELYDLKTDPAEMNNIYNNPGNEELIKNLKTELLELKKKYEDEDSEYPQMDEVVEKHFW